MRAEPIVVELSVADAPEILQLLKEVWPTTYGSAGCPVFTLSYLEWLYGGPLAHRNLLIGIRNDGGRLIGFRAYLYRNFTLGGYIPAYLATHATVHPALPMALRVAVATVIARPACLIRTPKALVIAFYEHGKPMARRRRDEALRSGHSFFEEDFLQLVVYPRRLAAADHLVVAAERPAVRPAQFGDVPALVALQDRPRPGILFWTPDAKALWHHLSAAPEAIALVAERDGRLLGGLGAYVLTTMRAGIETRMVVCDLLIGNDHNTMTVLMTAAQKQAAALSCRGVVIENASALSPDLQTAGGLVKTPRRMRLTIRTIDPLPRPILGYAGDVK